jgi:quercetin dioxygenase-like cupin family protein
MTAMSDSAHAQRSAGPVSRHTLAITVWIAVVPTLIALQPLLTGLLKAAPQPVRTLVTTTIAVPIVVYVVMPALLRITAHLINGEDEMSESTNEAKSKSTSESASAAALVRRAPDAEVLEADPTSVITLLADAEETGGNLTHFEPGNAGAPPHHHTRGAELFYVLDGSLQMLLGDEVTVFGKGDLVVVPPGVHHAFAPAPGASADVLIVFAPGTERFAYYRLLDRLHQGDASVQDLYDTPGPLRQPLRREPGMAGHPMKAGAARCRRRSRRRRG